MGKLSECQKKARESVYIKVDNSFVFSDKIKDWHESKTRSAQKVSGKK